MFFIFLAAFYITGCEPEKSDNPVTSGHEPGKALLKFNKSEIPPDVASITANLTRSGFETITGKMNILSDTTADLLLNNLAAGVWHLKVDAKNQTDKIIFSGETDVTISTTEIIQIFLTLAPTNENVGDINIFVSWGNYNSENKWVLQRSGTTANLHSVFFYDPLLGWAVGDSGIVLKTTDAGLSWKKQQSNVKDKLNSVCFLDISVGWAVGENGTILTTTNGGMDWDLNKRITTSALNSVCIINTFTSLIVGENGTIIYAYFTNENFQMKALESLENLTASFYIRANVGWLTGSKGNIYKSTDKGGHWFPTSNPSAGLQINSITFVDTGTGIAVGNSGLVLKTTNGGGAWTKIPSVTSSNLNCISFYNKNLGWIASEKGNIYKTTNGGLNWGYEITETNSDLESVVFIGESAGWAVGKNGVILKYKLATL